MIANTYLLLTLVITAVLFVEIRKEYIQYLYRKRGYKKEIEVLEKDLKKIKVEVLREIKNKTGGNMDMEDDLILYDSGKKLDIKNTKAIGELLDIRAEEEDYDLVLGLIIGRIKDMYENFEFSVMKPQYGDYLSGYAINFVIDGVNASDRQLMRNLFKLSLDRGLSEGILSRKFADLVEAGEVFELGDIIVDNGATGFSSLVTGEPIRVVITYETAEYKEKRLAQEEERDNARKEQEELREQQLKIREESHKALTEAAVILKEMSKEIIENHPGYVDAYERVKNMLERGL